MFFLDFISTVPGNVEVKSPRMGVTLFQHFPETFKWNEGNPRKDLHIIGPYIGRQRKFGSRPFALLHSFQKTVKQNQGFLRVNLFSSQKTYLVFIQYIVSIKQMFKNMAPVWPSGSYRFGSVKRERPSIPLVYRWRHSIC